MTLKSIMLQLRDEQITQLDAEAGRLGVSRSHLVRECVDQSFGDRFDTRVAEAYALAYASPGKDVGDANDVDEWGSLDDWHAAAAQARAQDARDPW